MPIEYIEESVMEWLVEAYMPEGITNRDEEEEVEQKVEAWLEDQEQVRQGREIG